MYVDVFLTERWCILYESLLLKQSSKQIQKQPPGGTLWKRCSEKYCFIHRKTTVLKSLFNKVSDLQSYNFIKKGLQHRRFLVNVIKFLNSDPEKHLRKATSANDCQKISSKVTSWTDFKKILFQRTANGQIICNLI